MSARKRIQAYQDKINRTGQHDCVILDGGIEPIVSLNGDAEPLITLSEPDPFIDMVARRGSVQVEHTKRG